MTIEHLTANLGHHWFALLRGLVVFAIYRGLKHYAQKWGR